MKKDFLISNTWKPLGWVLMLLSTGLWMYVSITGAKLVSFRMFVFIKEKDLSRNTYFSFTDEHQDMTNTLIGLIWIIGGLLVAFSRERQEDEYVSKLRLLAFQRSVLYNYILLAMAFAFVYGMPFFTIMIYNMFATLALFILIFRYFLFKNKGYEK